MQLVIIFDLFSAEIGLWLQRVTLLVLWNAYEM